MALTRANGEYGLCDHPRSALGVLDLRMAKRDRG